MQKRFPLSLLLCLGLSLGLWQSSFSQCATNGSEPTLLSAVNAPSNCFQQVAGGIGLGAGSRKIYSGFAGNTAYQLRMNMNGASSNCAQVRWVDNSNNPVSGWSGIDFSGFNGNASNLTSPAGATRLEVTINSTGWTGASALLNYRQTPPNSNLPFGANTWNVYGFDHNGYNVDNNLNLLAASCIYQGYYSNNNLDIVSTNQWGSGSTPSSAAGWQGCAVGVDNHITSYRRQGFPCGNYDLDLNNHDDAVRVYVNGAQVFQDNNCCADRGIIWSGYLSGSSTVEVRVTEGVGGSELNLDLIQTNSWSASASASPTSLCAGGSVALTSSTAGTYPVYSGSNNNDIGIPDNNATGIQSPIFITGTGLMANQLATVTLNINHPFTGDVDMYLVAPNGSQIDLSTDNGGNGDNYTNTVFSTSGGSITAGTAPFTGTFTPEQPFSNFTGSADGTWILRVIDDAGSDVGTLLDWRLAFTSPAITYAWSGNGGYSSSTQNPTLSPAATGNSGTFTVTATATGCTTTGTTANVSIVADPTVTVSGAADVCTGGSVTLTANVSGGTGTPSYQWRRNGVNVGGNSATYTTDNGLAAGTYSYDVIVTQTGSGCQGTSAAVNANVLADPTVTISGAADVCVGGSVTLTANVSGGTGTPSYQWRRNGANVGGNSATYTTDNGLVAGTYSYDVIVTQTGSGCQGTSATVNANVNASPAAVSVASSGTYCGGTVITASGGTGGTIYYQGTTSGGTSTALATTSQVITTSGTYYFRAQSGAGCWGPEGSANIVIQTPVPYYADVDGDGFGDPAVSTYACSAPIGYVSDNTDCNDANNTIYPGATEICDGLDNNCNGSTDEGLLNTYYADADADGFGNPAVTTVACSPPPGYVANNTDCNDGNNTVYPGAPELCDGLDNNCNGSTDEGVLTTYYADTDGDTYGDPLNSTQACSPPPGYVSNNTDCNDSNNSIYPGAFEICGNGIDEDCDGLDLICSGSVWNGSVSTDWNTPANWTPIGIPNNCASDVTIPLVANQPSITGADFNVGNMMVSNGVIISIQNGFKLNVCGNVNATGVTGLQVDGGELSFIGTTAQTATGNINADAVILSNPNGLTLVTGGSLSVSVSLSLRSGVLTSNNNLTMLSNASGTAYVDDFSGGFTGSISGNIRVQRYNPIGLAGFRQLGTPVQLPNISAVTGFTPSGTAGFVIPVPTCDPNYVAFNSPYGNWMQLVENGTVQYACHQSLFQVLTGGGMTSGRGYYMDVAGNSTLTFTGAATTGPVTFGLTHANAAVTNGWNMVSNPYPSPLAWEVGNVPAGVDGIGKIWVTSGAYTGTWQDVDPNIPGTAIAIGQAFQVRVTTAGASVPFTVDNSDRTTAPPTYLFAGGPGMTLNIDILGNGFADVTKVRFMDDATTALDAMYDSPKLMGNANQPMVYSIWNGENYSTNSFGQLTDVYALPLGVKVSQAGQHTLVFSNLDQFPASALVYLEDTETGAAWQDVRANDTYVFTETAGHHTDRFILHFYPPVQSTITDATCDVNGQAVLTEETPLTWNYVLSNSQSQAVSQGVLDGSQTVNNLPAGTYTLTLTEPVSGYVAVETVIVTGAVQVSAQALASALTVETGQEIQFTANTTGADAWHWNFGDQNTSTDQNPTHFYNAAGVYEVVLTASNGNCQTVSQVAITVQGSASIEDEFSNAGVNLWNSGNVVYIQFLQPWTGKTMFTLYDMQGRKLVQKQWNNADGSLTVDCGVLAAGTYTVELSGQQQTITRKTVMGIH